MAQEGEENSVVWMLSLRMEFLPFHHDTLGREHPLPKGISPSLHCLAYCGGFLASQRPSLQDKAAVLGACQLQWWSNKICQQRKHTTPSCSCCSCFLFSVSAYPLGPWLTQKATKGDIRVSIWHCPPGVMYMKAYGTALLTHQQTQEELYPSYLVGFPYGSKLSLQVDNLHSVYLQNSFLV